MPNNYSFDESALFYIEVMSTLACFISAKIVKMVYHTYAYAILHSYWIKDVEFKQFGGYAIIITMLTWEYLLICGRCWNQ